MCPGANEVVAQDDPVTCVSYENCPCEYKNHMYNSGEQLEQGCAMW